MKRETEKPIAEQHHIFAYPDGLPLNGDLRYIGRLLRYASRQAKVNALPASCIFVEPIRASKPAGIITAISP
jgi:hypothetical protein